MIIPSAQLYNDIVKASTAATVTDDGQTTNNTVQIETADYTNPFVVSEHPTTYFELCCYTLMALSLITSGICIYFLYLLINKMKKQNKTLSHIFTKCLLLLVEILTNLTRLICCYDLYNMIGKV